MEWNLTGSLLMLRFGEYLDREKGTDFITATDNIPTAIYLFDFPTSREKFVPKLRTVLIHSQPVIHVRWNPVRKGSLALCCGTQSVYIWSDEWHTESNDDQEEMAECIGVPASTSFFSSTLSYLHLMPGTHVIQGILKPKIFSGLLTGRV